MPAIDRFVARLNIEHFQNKLATETDAAKRKTLLTLLAEERAKLEELENGPPIDDQKQA